MKSPFRSIRQTLFNEGKLVRYIGYAIGEVVLIIVGILFALKINDWNEDRKAQAGFDEYVIQLMEDVKLAISVAEGRIEGSGRRKKQALTVLRILKDHKTEPENLKEFEDALDGLGRFALQDINYGHLGNLLDSELDAIARDKDLSNKALVMTREVKAIFARLEENWEVQKLSIGTFAKHRGMTHTLSPGVKLRYDLESLRSSDEFINATQNTIYFLSVTGDGYDRIKDVLESFLTVLEEYE